MLDALSTALILKLKETFPGIKVYDEPIQQGMETPCLNIKANRINTDRQVNNAVDVAVFYFITYTPGDSLDKRTEMNGMVWTILNSKRWKYLGDFAHINYLKANHNDEVMTISFEVKIHGSYEADPGETITKIEGGVKL
ncbi:phage tail terminator family protein [Fundicoccus sp. Sow4_D5]|uniref:phage tail terminator family protein n=1 Tax=Fundicoccus sp. Sow4_D5 TaxID=3438782 RepID=UPI003F91FBF1